MKVLTSTQTQGEWFRLIGGIVSVIATGVPDGATVTLQARVPGTTAAVDSDVAFNSAGVKAAHVTKDLEYRVKATAAGATVNLFGNG